MKIKTEVLSFDKYQEFTNYQYSNNLYTVPMDACDIMHHLIPGTYVAYNDSDVYTFEETELPEGMFCDFILVKDADYQIGDFDQIVCVAYICHSYAIPGVAYLCFRYIEEEESDEGFSYMSDVSWDPVLEKAIDICKDNSIDMLIVDTPSVEVDYWKDKGFNVNIGKYYIGKVL